MKLNTILMANAIVALLFAAIALFAPAQLLATYGAATDPTGHLMTRYFGAVLIGIALWSWLGRRVVDAELRRMIIVSQMITWVAVLVMDVWGLVAGLVDGREWGNIVLALLFLVAYGVCLQRGE